MGFPIFHPINIIIQTTEEVPTRKVTKEDLS